MCALPASEACGQVPEDETFRPWVQPINPHVPISADESTGALHYGYSFALPPGRLGVAPSLSLSYNSQDHHNDSMVGYGWSLDIPSISRHNRYGLEQMYNRHDFSSSLSGELVAIDIDENGYGTYGAKVETGSFLRYRYGENGWTVTTKEGQVYRFGTIESARLEDSEDALRVHTWLVTEMRDIHGNWVRYDYEKDGGRAYPDRVAYTGHGDELDNNDPDNNGAPQFEVHFSREDRADETRMYNKGFLVETEERISSIEIFERQGLGGLTLRAQYDLEYTTGDNGVRSMLASITHTAVNPDGEELTLPPTEFTYSRKAYGWEETQDHILPIHMNWDVRDRGVRIVDINGDAYPDVIYAQEEREDDEVHFVSQTWLHDTQNAWVETEGEFAPPAPFITWDRRDKGLRLLDTNGDFLVDFISSKNQEDRMWTNTGSRWTEIAQSDIPVSLAFNSGANHGLRFTDLNADGLNDFVHAPLNRILHPDFPPHENLMMTVIEDEIFLNEGQRWVEKEDFNFPKGLRSLSGKPLSVRLFDVNGDDIDDVIYVSPSVDRDRPLHRFQDVWLNMGFHPGQWEHIDEPGFPEESSFIASGNDLGVRVVDINGDGLADMVRSKPAINSRPEIKRVWLGTGMVTNWVNINEPNIPDHFVNTTSNERGIRFADLNADGLVDMFRSAYNTAVDRWPENGNEHHQHVWLARGPVPDMLVGVRTGGGAVSRILYKPSSHYRQFDAVGQSMGEDAPLSNPKMPMVMQTVFQVETEDGLGNVSSRVTYQYEGGRMFYVGPRDRKFAGFSRIIKTDAEGNRSILYVHQGKVYQDDDVQAVGSMGQDRAHRSKMGRTYRVEMWDPKRGLLSRSFTRYGVLRLDGHEGVAEEADALMDVDNAYAQLADEQNEGDLVDIGEVEGRYFVVPVAEVQFSVEGSSEKARGVGSLSAYDKETGNTVRRELLGLVRGDVRTGAFLDMGEDRLVTRFRYARPLAVLGDALPPFDNEVARESAMHMVAKVSEQWTEDHGGERQSWSRHFYDGLVLGEVGDRGNLTAIEQWREGEWNGVPDFVRTEQTYHEFGQLEVSRDALGHETRMSYDPRNLYVAKVENALGHQTSHEVDVFTGAEIRSVDANGVVTEQYIDGLGRVTEVRRSRPDGIEGGASSDDGEADIVLKRIRYVDVPELQDGSRSVVETVYLEEGHGMSHVRYIDGHGRVIQTRMPTDGINTGNAQLLGEEAENLGQRGWWVNQTKYDERGQVEVTHLPVYANDSGYRFIFVPKHRKRIHSYDALGRLRSLSDVHGVSRIEYRPGSMQRIDAQGRVTSEFYDGHGQMVAVIEPWTAQAGSRDDSGWYFPMTSIQRDPLGRMISLRNTQGDIKEMGYNKLGWRQWASYWHRPDDEGVLGVERYGYNENGQLLWSLYPDGIQVNFERDALGRVTEEDVLQTEEVETRYLYDACDHGLGRLCETSANIEEDGIEEEGAGQAFDQWLKTYDRWGRVIAQTANLKGQSAMTVRSAYNRMSEKTFQAVSGIGAIISYDYNRAGQLRGLYRTGDEENLLEREALITDLSYGAAGQLKEAHYANGVITKWQYAYNQGDRLIGRQSFVCPHGQGEGVSSCKLTTAEAVHQNTAYSYDAVGNITGVEEQAEGPLQHRAFYQYDVLNRLTEAVFEDIGDDGQPQQAVRSFGYDWAGNLREHSEVGTYVYGTERQQNVPGDGFVLPMPQAVTGIDEDGDGTLEQHFVYDIRGQLLHRQEPGAQLGLEMAYDALGRMVQSREGDEVVHYRYGSGRRRIEKHGLDDRPVFYPFEGIEVRADGFRLSLTFAGETLLTLRQAEGDGRDDQPEGQLGQEGLEAFYYHPDHLHGTALVTNEAGEIEQTLGYYPFGETRMETNLGNFDVTQKFTGHERDETGLYYAKARYYDPHVGRFTSRDNWEGNIHRPQSLNPYSYVENNPIRFVDPTGHYRSDAFKLAGHYALHGGYEFVSAGGKAVGAVGLFLESVNPLTSAAASAKVVGGGILATGALLDLGDTTASFSNAIVNVKNAFTDRGPTYGMLENPFESFADDVGIGSEAINITQEVSDYVGIATGIGAIKNALNRKQWAENLWNGSKTKSRDEFIQNQVNHINKEAGGLVLDMIGDVIEGPGVPSRHEYKSTQQNSGGGSKAIFDSLVTLGDQLTPSFVDNKVQDMKNNFIGALKKKE